MKSHYCIIFLTCIFILVMLSNVNAQGVQGVLDGNDIANGSDTTSTNDGQSIRKLGQGIIDNIIGWIKGDVGWSLPSDKELPPPDSKDGAVGINLSTDKKKKITSSQANNNES